VRSADAREGQHHRQTLAVTNLCLVQISVKRVSRFCGGALNNHYHSIDCVDRIVLKDAVSEVQITAY
jgi:hypothetical protein